MLDVAARDVARSWDPGPDGASVDDVKAQLRPIVAAIQESVVTERVPPIDIEPWLPARRILDDLRQCFIARAQASTHLIADVLRVLYAIERVQGFIEEGISQRFRTQLAGPGALQLLAEVAHDMRSPLTAILMLVESLRRGGDRLPAALKRRLGLVYGAALGLSTLAENLFDVARGTSLIVEPQPVPFSIKEKMQAVRDIVLPIAEEKGLLVEFELRGADCRIGHSHAIQRVLLNLATNALKFTHRGFVRMQAADIGGSRLLFEVRDSGPGMEAEMLEKICSPFRPMMHLGRVSFSTPGLGLSIAQKLVTVMGGTLCVRSEVGKGSCFSFELDLPIAAAR